MRTVNILSDGYHPWTAEFKDGTYLTRLECPDLKFSAVLEKEELLYAVYIHLDWTSLVGVNLDTGMFYRGSRPGDAFGWFKGPRHQDANRYRVYYSRQCQAQCSADQLAQGKIKGSVTGYTLGWTTIAPEGDAVSCLMTLDLLGNYRWR